MMSTTDSRRSPGLVRRLLTAFGLMVVTAFLVLLPATAASAGPAVGGAVTAAGAVTSFGSVTAAGGERMTDFKAAYDLQTDGSMKVKETITWQFADGARNHGIFRNIVVRMGYNNEEGKYRSYAMSDVSVSSPTGAPDQFKVSQNGASNQIRIGNADDYTSGTQVYQVDYTLAAVLNPIAGDQKPAATAGAASTVELNYNVFGTNETTERDNVSVSVTGPAASTKVLCFEGVNQSDTPCQGAAGDLTTFMAKTLASGDAMTVIASYPASAFDPGLKPDVREGDSGSATGSAAAPAVNAAAWAGGIGAPVLAAAVMGALVYTRGRDEKYADLTPGLSPTAGTAGAAATTLGGRTTVAVQFTPPQGVQPGMVGTVMDETANPIDVSATVIDLAVRGFLTIEETGKDGMFSHNDWTLTRLAPPTNERLLPYERMVYDGIFSSRGDVVSLSELKNTFATTLKSVQAEMYREVVSRGWFRSSPQAQRGVWQGLAVVLAVAGGLLLFWGRAALSTLLGGAFTGGAALGVGLILAGGIVYVLGGKMAAKTAEGSAVYAQSLGFKEYLVTAEAGQIAFDEASNIFSRYLPYAVVFGVADRWAKTFADVARAAEAANQSLVMPTWYLWSGAAFPDFAGIANGVDNFSSTSTGTFASTPGSSGGSGFSGGGFSGGGGGGSSSGSW